MSFRTTLIFLASFGLGACVTTSDQTEKIWNRTEREQAQVHLVRLALKQSESYSPRWEPAQRDCAGFVRFLFREAVTGRAEMWLDKDQKPTAFVSARELVAYNFEKVPLNVSLDEAVQNGEIQTGDLLVFHRPDQNKSEDAWHLMIALRSPHGFQKGVLWTYHNGEKGELGEVRKVRHEDLSTSPFSEWRPQADNPHFYGVYRWKEWL